MTDVAAGQLRQHRPFDRLSPERAAALEPQLELRHYRLGQTLLRPELLPDGVVLVIEGTLRSLAIDPVDGELHTLELLERAAQED